MQEGVQRESSPSVLLAGKEVESAVAVTSEGTGARVSASPPHAEAGSEAPVSRPASAAAGETLDAPDPGAPPRSCSSSPRSQTNLNLKAKSVAALNNNGEGMKCLGAIEYNMKDERYFLLNKNTFQEIFDATLHEMTGAATPVSRRVEVNIQPVEGYDRESAELRSSGANYSDRRRSSSSSDKASEFSGAFGTTDSGSSCSSKKFLNVKTGAKRSGSYLGQTNPREYEPSTPRKITEHPGMLSAEVSRTDRESHSVFPSRVTALNDITNDHHGVAMTSGRSIPTATQSTAPNHFLPLDMENEPLDLTVCRRGSKSSSVDSKCQSSGEDHSAPGSPVNLVRTDKHPGSGEVPNSFTATESEGNDKNSLSDSEEDEIDLVEVVSTSSGENGDGATFPRHGATEASCKHSASERRRGAAGRAEAAAAAACCWQPARSVPTEPGCQRTGPRGSVARSRAITTTHTQPARSIDGQIPAHSRSLSSTETTTVHKSSSKKRNPSGECTMTGVSGGMATTRMKSRATENWAALSKAAVYDIVEEMVLKMDEEESSDASRSPSLSAQRSVRKSASASALGDSSGTERSSRPASRQPTEVVAMDDRSSGRSRLARSNVSTSKSVMHSFDQSLSPASQFSTSQLNSSPEPARNHMPHLVKPGSKSGSGKTTDGEDPDSSDRTMTTNTAASAADAGDRPEHVKQCWVALNKMMVFDIVETAIQAEAKESNNNVCGSDSRSGTPDSVSSRNSSNVVVDDDDDDDDDEQVGLRSRKEPESGDAKSRKRKCDDSSSHASASGKYAKQTARDFPLGLERVSMNESCGVPKRPRSSDCTSGDIINTDISPPKQRRKSAEINRSNSSETYFVGNKKQASDNHPIGKSDQGQKRAQDKEGKEAESRATPAARISHDHRVLPHSRSVRSVTAGQPVGRAGHTSLGDKASIKSRSSPALPDESLSNKRKLASTSTSQHAGASRVHDLPTSSITHLVQSQRTTIDYGRTSNEKILAVKQAGTKKLNLHSATPSAHQAAAAVRSRSGVPVNNQYVLDDTRDNNGDREIKRKRSKFDNAALKEPLPIAGSGLDSCSRPVSLCSTDESNESKDARSSPRLGWVAVSKADVHNLFNSVVDSMMASDAIDATHDAGSAGDRRPSGAATPPSRSAPPGVSSARTTSPANSAASSAGPGTTSSGSSPRCQQVDCESGSNRPNNERGGACSPPSPSDKAACLQRTHSPSGSSDNLDSEHIIVDPGSPGDMLSDAEGKDSRSNRSKTFKWKSNLLMRVHEQSQTAPLARSSNTSSPSSESGSDKSDKGLGQSSSTLPVLDEPRGQSRHQTTSSRSSRRSGKKGHSHSSARAK